MELDQALHLLTFHPGKPQDLHKYDAVRAAAKQLAAAICDACPDSAERTLALRALHLTTMHAISAIVLA